MKSFKTFIKEFEQSWQDQTNAFHAGIRSESGIGMRDFSESIEDEKINKSYFENNKRINSLHDELSHRHDYGIDDHQNLKDYTRQSSYINGHLWDNHINPKSEDEGYGEQIKGLDNALSRYKVKTPMTVWSSTKHDPRIKKNEQGILHHPAYMSTSLDKSVAMNRKINAHVDENRDEHHHVLKIDVPTETHGAYVGHISKFRSEKEFILPRGMNFRYHGTETHSSSGIDPYTEKRVKFHTHVHHLSVVPHENT